MSKQDTLEKINARREQGTYGGPTEASRPSQVVAVDHRPGEAAVGIDRAYAGRERALLLA